MILGWSDSIFTIVRELTVANESRRKPVIVVLADRDKVEMEEDLRAKVTDFRGTRVICRSGSPMDLDDLALSSHASARSVILLAPEGSEDPDSEVIKTLLALTHGGPGGPRIVAGSATPPTSRRPVWSARPAPSCSTSERRSPSWSCRPRGSPGPRPSTRSCSTTTGTRSDFLEEHSLDGSTYAQAQQAFEEASVIGLISPTGPKLNPLPDTRIDGPR